MTHHARRLTHVLTTMTLALGLLVLAAAGASAHDAFAGTWTSIDTDGSNQTLYVGGSGQAGRHAVSLFDDMASMACDGAPARAQGSGVVEGGTLYWQGTVTCPAGGRGPATGRVGGFELTYNEGTDTLTDASGVVWHRGS